MRYRNIFIFLCAGVIFFIHQANIGRCVNVSSQSPEYLFNKGESFYQNGDIEHAAQYWKQMLAIPDIEKDTARYLDTVMRLSHAYQALGYHQSALSVLISALPVVKKITDSTRKALFFSSFGDLYLSLENMITALDYLEKAETEARNAHDPLILASVLNNLANLYVADENYQGAVDIYDEALEHIASFPNSGLGTRNSISEESEIQNLKSKILINLVFAISQAGTFQDISGVLKDAVEYIINLPDSHDKANHLTGLGIHMGKIRKNKEIGKTADDDLSLVKTTWQVFDKAKQIVEKLKDNRIVSCVYGYMGELYEAQQRYDEAISMTRSAIFFADQEKLPEILYLWQWQMGRLVNAKNDIENAVKFYYRAIDTLNLIRQELLKGYRSQKDSFNENIKPVYLELAELLIEQVSANSQQPTANSQFREVIEILETLKTSELQDFFQDECVSAIQKKIPVPEHTISHTAIIYPIMLPDKLALLLILPDGITLNTVPVASGELREKLVEFRARLQTRSTNQFFHNAWQIYDWLMRPVELLLVRHEIDTLIIVPDGALRLIPFSALHDGRHFLAEKYAVGTVPAITLTDYKSAELKDAEILLAGLSENVQGFPPLPEVPNELETVRQIMNGRVVLQDRTYTIDNLTHELRNTLYSVVHLATHGVFGGSSENSFLLTYDGRLTINHLQHLMDFGRIHNKQADLLIMSACQTAHGDERAALGLGGVALKAGVKGAIASLWYVDDEATALIFKKFYKQLRTGLSKAKALQNAQKELIIQRRYRHPGYWSPFLLIGS